MTHLEVCAEEGEDESNNNVVNTGDNNNTVAAGANLLDNTNDDTFLDTEDAEDLESEATTVRCGTPPPANEAAVIPPALEILPSVLLNPTEIADLQRLGVTHSESFWKDVSTHHPLTPEDAELDDVAYYNGGKRYGVRVLIAFDPSKHAPDLEPTVAGRDWPPRTFEWWGCSQVGSPFSVGSLGPSVKDTVAERPPFAPISRTMLASWHLCCLPPLLTLFVFPFEVLYFGGSCVARAAFPAHGVAEK